MDSTGAKLVLGFVTLLLGVILASQVAIQGNTVTDKTIVSNEVVSIATAVTLDNQLNVTVNTGPIANVPTGLLIEDCPLTAITVSNTSGTDLTVTTDYTLSTTTGVLNILNTTATVEGLTGDNNTNIDYTYCPTSYTNVSWGRTSIDTAMGLYALGVFLISVGLFFSVAKDAGIIGK